MLIARLRCNSVILLSTLCGAVSLWGQQLPAPSIFPQVASAGMPATVMVTVEPSAPNVILAGVNVQKVDGNGRVLAVLGSLHDDGNSPDLEAGDGVYSGNITVSEAQAGMIQLRVSAALSGSLLRAVSATSSVQILPAGMPTAPAASDFTQTVTDAATGSPIVGNEVVACFAPGTDPRTIMADAALVNATLVGGSSDLSNCYQYKLAAASGAAAVAAAAAVLAARPEVAAAGPDFVSMPMTVPTCNLPACTDPQSVAYNHLQFNTAHAISMGANVRVILVDTVVDVKSVPQVLGMIRVSNLPVVQGITAATGHGTMTAGILVASAPLSKFYSVVSLNELALGSAFNLAEGIFIAATNHAKIINVSAVVPDVPVTRRQLNWAMASVTASGALLVAAAGNFGPNFAALPAGYGASMANVLSVGAVNGNDVRATATDFMDECSGTNPPPQCQLPGAPGSYYGQAVQLAGPGVCVHTAFLTGYSAASKNCNTNGLSLGNAIESGTSAAAPFVAGAAALLWSLHPGWAAAQVAQQLVDTAIPINPNPATTSGGKSIDTTYNQQLGAGLVDPVTALYNCTMTLTGQNPTGYTLPSGFPPELGPGAIYTGVFRYNSNTPAASGFCNAQGCSFLGSFQLTAGGHTWAGRSLISAGLYAYDFDQFGNGSTSLSSDGQYRLYELDYQFQGSPYPFSLLTDKSVLDSSTLKLLQLTLSSPGNPNAAFASLNVYGNILSTSLSCNP